MKLRGGAQRAAQGRLLFRTQKCEKCEKCGLGHHQCEMCILCITGRILNMDMVCLITSLDLSGLRLRPGHECVCPHGTRPFVDVLVGDD